MATQHKPKRVALALPIGLPHQEQHLRGILRFASTRGNWRIEVSPDSPSISVSSLRGWSGDGIVALINTAAEARTIAGLRIPAVNLSGVLAHSPVPRVSVDNRAVGRLAATHLLDCGFRRLAYYGVKELWYSSERCEGFREAIGAAGAEYPFTGEAARGRVKGVL